MPSAQELVTLAVNGEAADFATMTNEILTSKIHDALEARKIAVAKEMFGKKAVEAAISVGQAEEPEATSEVDATVAVANTAEVQPDAGATA